MLLLPRVMSRTEIRGPEDPTRATPIKRRRLLPLVDLRGPAGVAGEFEPSSGTLSRTSSLSGPVPISMEISGSASLGPGRRSRPALTDLTKGGFCSSIDSTDGFFGTKCSSVPVTISHLTGRSPRDDSVSRFPRLDQCAHFHYEFVELPSIQVSLVSEELKPLSQGPSQEDTENRALLVQVASLGRSWVVRRTFDNFRFLDRQLHRCCYDRKISQLPELPTEENIAGTNKVNAVEIVLKAYLSRLSSIAGSLITCGPVLSWLELDNRGHRLIVTDDSDINTPAVAAAYVIKRYTAQASDEISFEVGDMISVIDMPPPEESIWWRGKRGFQVGFFPCECVQVIEGKVPQGIHPSSLTLPPTKSFGVASPNSLPSGSIGGILSAQEPMKPVLRKHGKLIAFFRSFILSRPPRPWLKRSGILRERVFGCDLAEHLLNSGHEIPMVLKCCSEFIETHGTVDGIYRLSGITSNIQKLRNAFDEERVPALYEDDSILHDIHCVSSVLKMYFRELPNPLLTYQLYDKFANAVMQDEHTRLLQVRDVVQQLPPPHYRTLEYLVRHLARVASHSNRTGMTPKNIAIVWAPNLLRSKDLERGGVAALQDVGTQAVVTEYLVRYVELIFSDKIPILPSIGDPILKTQRPKSLAISTPIKLLTIDEARKRSLASIKIDQNYIDVGGGPGTLPKTYHTVIDLPSRKGGSLKHKKSPLGWKTFFWKNKNQKKPSLHDGFLNISDPAVLETDILCHHSKRLRPVKSVESLASTPASLHSSGNSQAVDQNEISQREIRPLESSTSTPFSSPRTHNRSTSHDSFFNMLDRNQSSPTVKDDTESDFDFSSSSPKMCLEMTELNIEFNISENDVRIFSEDETLQSTSIDTNSRSTLDMEGLSMSSDRTRSKENISLRQRKSLKDQLRHPFNHKRKENRRSSSSDSRYLHKKVVSPKTSGQGLPPLATIEALCSTSQSSDEGSKSKEYINYDDLDETPSRESMETALIDPELLDRITHLRVSPLVSPCELSSVSASENASPDKTITPHGLNARQCTPSHQQPVPSKEPSFPVANQRPTNLGLNSQPIAPLGSPETPQGDSTFLEIQYDPLSDTTEPSSPSESHHREQSSPLSPDISSGSSEETPDYENVDLKEEHSSDPDTPVGYEPLPQASESMENLHGHTESQTPSYENLSYEYTNLLSTPVVTEKQDETIDDTESQENLYENVSFNAPSYENCAFSSIESDKQMPVDVVGEVVYQQVKYLKQSIKEVNEILNDTETPPRRTSITKLTIHMASKQNIESQSDVSEASSQPTESDLDSSLEKSQDSECLESPVTPSTTSLLTEVFVLPSFSSPTGSAQDVLIKEPELLMEDNYLPVVDPSVPTCLPSLSASPDSPNSSQSLVAPIPLPRTIPMLFDAELKSSSPTNDLSTSVVPLSIEHSPPPSPLDDSKYDATKPLSPTEPKKASLETDPIEIAQTFSLPETNVEERLTPTEPCSLPNDSPETETQRRERIEKYKAERRSFLRKNYNPNSFKGEKDDMILRLKQKATSPSRTGDGDDSKCIDGISKVPKNTIIEEASRSSANELDFQTNNKSPSLDKERKMCVKSLKSNKLESKVDKGITPKKLQQEEDEINVKERVAIWSRQKSDVSLDGEKKNIESTPKKEEKPIASSMNRKFTPPTGLKTSSSSSKISQLTSTFSSAYSKPTVPNRLQLANDVSRGSKPPTLASPKAELASTAFKTHIPTASETNMSRPVFKTQKSESCLPSKINLKPTKRYSSGSPIEAAKAAKILHETIGQDKIKAITAQFERDSVTNTKPIFVRQVSK